MSTSITNRGFTLLEMIVSVGIFSIVMLIAIGAYLVIINADRRARTTNDLATSLTFAVDNINRSIRTGSAYQCAGGTNCWPAGGSSLALTDDLGQTVTYLLKTDNTIGKCSTLPCTTSNAISITDPRITIQSLVFYVAGVGTSDTLQPRVTFVIQGSVRPDATSTPTTFSIQSTAVQRTIDL